MSTGIYEKARDLAVVMLRNEVNPTEEQLRERAMHAVQTAKLCGAEGEIDFEAFVADLRHSFSIVADPGAILEDHTDHIAWMPDKKAVIPWKFWRRYETYLEQDFGMPVPVVRVVNELTDAILERLEDPMRPAPWDRRGMVVGSVQSGKTANYTGLICKALDAGYKLIIVLAGTHKNLRSQTQLRLDEGVLGFDTQQNRRLNADSRWVGVGNIPQPNGERLYINSLTSSADNGDFSRTVAKQIGVMVGSDPVVLVVKKNVSVLRNLLGWVLHVAGTDEPGKDRRVVRNVPLLLIDDEADHASINTKAHEEDENPTAINARIRETLEAFEKSAYVGYTATPFANIFINPDVRSSKYGDDIFPRSFIINVKAPTNYIGPARVFGVDGDPDAGTEASDPLPIVRVLEDFDEQWSFSEAYPPKHKKEHDPSELPDTLRRAIRCFILTCAARRVRGQEKKHNSMLVHVTRFTAVQNRTLALVRAELDDLQRRIAYGDGKRSPTLIEELAALWEEEFVPVSQTLAHEVTRPVTWKEMLTELHPAAAKIEVKEINGTARDALDYVEHPEGRSVIAVGGDKLSRGLTLEGLSVSYFLRASRMYDTLMQMGRWFGYRDGYLDLCRLFTTGDLIRWYRHIALAEQELRREFDYMVASGLTPERYNLKVRQHSEGLLITALNKMSATQILRLSYAGELVQTAHFDRKDTIIQKNFEVTDRFLKTLPPPQRYGTGEKPNAWIWTDVPAGQLLKELIPDFSFHPQSFRLDPERLSTFIQRQNEQEELTHWTVAVVSNTKPQPGSHPPCELGGCKVEVTERSAETWKERLYSTTNANIQSPAHQALDLASMRLDEPTLAGLLEKRVTEGGPALFRDGEPEMLAAHLNGTLLEAAEALTLHRQPPKEGAVSETKGSKLNGRYVREVRPATHGLLLIYALVPKGQDIKRDQKPFIGFAFSFPTSHTARTVEYRANKVLLTEIDDENYDAD